MYYMWLHVYLFRSNNLTRCHYISFQLRVTGLDLTLYFASFNHNFSFPPTFFFLSLSLSLPFSLSISLCVSQSICLSLSISINHFLPYCLLLSLFLSFSLYLFQATTLLTKAITALNEVALSYHLIIECSPLGLYFLAVVFAATM